MNEKKLRDLIQEEMKAALGSNEKSSEKEGTKKEESKVEDVKTAEELIDELGNKIVNAVQEKKGGNEEDASYLREKYFNSKNGVEAIKYPKQDEIKNLSDDDKIVVFFKSMLNREKDMEANFIFKALTEGTAADGGYLVPAPLANRVWEILPDITIMRKLATIIPMTSETLGLNRLVGRPEAYWTNEYASKTTTSADIGQRTLTAYKLVCLLPAAHELIQDANIDLVQFIIKMFAEAIARKEDQAFFTGSGVGRPTGISQETIASQSAGASIDFDDILDLVDLVPQSVSKSAAFVGNRQVKKLLRKVKDTNGAYIWTSGLNQRVSEVVERLPDNLYGYPFYEQNDLSQDELYFGDWSRYIIGDRKQMTVETTNVGGDAWRRDATEVKAVERVGGIAVDTRAFAKLTDV